LKLNLVEMFLIGFLFHTHKKELYPTAPEINAQETTGNISSGDSTTFVADTTTVGPEGTTGAEQFSTA
jgi:hypothetical protein